MKAVSTVLMIVLISMPAAGSPQLQQGQPAAPAAAPVVFKDIDTFVKSLPRVEVDKLDETLALELVAMPLSCIDRPHARPSNRGYLWEASYRPPDDFERTRAFYGCFDWHSAVNSTWALVKALKMFPALSVAPLVRAKLDRHLGKSNIEGEIAFFQDAGTFELPYGYAWVLKLQGELLSWKDPDAAKWTANLAPLVAVYSKRLTEYFKTLERPVRTGVHPNTALAMNLMFDYLDIAKDDTLKTAVFESAQRFYAKDEKCETAAEPGPSDFISPCLTEASLMARVVDQPTLLAWLDKFLPPLFSADFKPLTQPIDPNIISKPERIAAKSHMIGLAFMRAETMNRLAAALPAADSRAAALRRLAAMHANQGTIAMHAAGYAGSHYLGAFSILYLISATP